MSCGSSMFTINLEYQGPFLDSMKINTVICSTCFGCVVTDILVLFLCLPPCLNPFTVYPALRLILQSFF